MKFTKMQGCGNDYVYVDCTQGFTIADEAEAARKKTLGYKVEKAASRTANSALNSLGRKVAKEIFKNIFKK